MLQASGGRQCVDDVTHRTEAHHQNLEGSGGIQITISTRLHEIERNFRNAICADAGHTAMVDGALALEAGAALDRLAHHAGEGARGSGGGIVGGSEDGDSGNAERGGDMHSARIVGEIHAAGGGEIDVFRERRFAGEVVNRDGYSGLWATVIASRARTGADADRGASAAALPGEVLRLQRAALHEKLRELHGIELSYS